VLALRFKESKIQNAPLATKKPFKKENQTQGQHTLFAIVAPLKINRSWG